MSTGDPKIRKVIIFFFGIIAAGGEEKLLFEQAKYFEKKDIETYILTYRFSGNAYGDVYKMNIDIINKKPTLQNLLLKTIYEILALRKRIKEINPDIIISHDYRDCIYLYFATLFIPVPYVVHIPETIFRSDKCLEKYALIHRKVFDEIRNSTIGGREFISLKPPKSSLIRRMIAEFIAIAIYIGVKKAKRVFVLSNQMKWEIDKLYGKGKDTIVLKGAFPSEIFEYKPKENIKKKLGLTDKRLILNVNRLVSRKRVDLLIKAFKHIYDKFDDVVLVIGGTGPEEKNLKNLTKEWNIESRVKFMGYIPEEERKDYYACCDVFAHPNWADFAIAPFEALAMQKKVVWSSEMDIDENLVANKHVFVANPTTNDFADAVEKALNTEIPEDDDLSDYTWEKYFEEVMRNLKS